MKQKDRLGKGVMGLLSPTASGAKKKPTAKVLKEETPSPRVGRPPVHSEGWKKVTVVLLHRQIASLDRLSSDIMLKTGAVVKRAEIIRGVVEALCDSKLDVTTATSEAEIKGAVIEKLNA